MTVNLAFTHRVSGTITGLFQKKLEINHSILQRLDNAGIDKYLLNIPNWTYKESLLEPNFTVVCCYFRD
ncbi:MAG: hypothetical protein AAF915_08340 [Cyanobacteria bacterium P01_D01_bin.50]